MHAASHAAAKAKPDGTVAEPLHMAHRAFTALLRDDSGQGLVEYAIIIALVAMAAIAALRFFGGSATNSLNTSANKMPG